MILTRLILAFSLLAYPVAEASNPSTSMAVGQEKTYSVPWEESYRRQIVELTINGEGPFRFIMDTGAGGMSISGELKEKLGLTATGKVQVGSPAGGKPVEVETVTLDAVNMGGAGASDVRAHVMVFDRDFVDGVMGPWIFREHGRVAFDFTRQEIEIGGEVSDSNANWIEMGNSAPILDVPLVIGDNTIAAHLDTGAPQVIAIPKQYGETLPLLAPMQVIGTARTIDREFEILGAPIKASAKAGDATIHLSDLQFFDLPFANIGLGAMKGLKLEIDWAGNRFRLEGESRPDGGRRGPRMVRSNGPDSPDAQSGPRRRAPTDGTFGVMLDQGDGALTVSNIMPGSRAEGLGVQVGDQIVSINGQKVEAMEQGDIRSGLSGSNFKSITVLRDGAQIVMEARN